MIFENPWAWIGLFALAAPVAAHLLSRRPPTRQPFPTLRFLPAGAVRPVRRDRLADVPLLACRCAIVALAVAALAQPWWRTAARARDLDAQVARAIVIEAPPGGASSGDTAADWSAAARRQAASALAEAAVARVAETPAVADVLPGAIAWLSSQPMRRELLVLTGGQRTEAAGASLDSVPSDIAVRVVAVGNPTGERPGNVPHDVTLLVAKSDEPIAAALRAAAIGTDERPDARGARLAVLFPRHEGRDAILAAATPPDEAWMFDAFAAIASNPTVVAAASRRRMAPADLVSPHTARIDGTTRLLLVTDIDPSSVEAAALVSAAARVQQPGRQPGHQLPRKDLSETAPSDGRWLWLVVLGLLVVEGWLRRPQRESAFREAPGEHAA